MWLFYITIVFGFVYLALYPGAGQAARLAGLDVRRGLCQGARRVRQGSRSRCTRSIVDMDVAAIARDPAGAGDRRAAVPQHCAQCHGSDAGGSKGYPNLRDSDWLFGGDPATIAASIADGRNGVMPAFGATLGQQGVDNVVALRAQPLGASRRLAKSQLGKPLFAANCAACHGADGKGNPALGAPNLADNDLAVRRIPGGGHRDREQGPRRSRGAVTRMPAHKDLLDPAKIRMLTAYVWGLSNRGK